MITKTISMFPASVVPKCQYTESQFLLFADWLPIEDRDAEYKPAMFIGLWEDGGWWILAGGYEPLPDQCAADDPSHCLRPVLFERAGDSLSIIGWAPLFGHPGADCAVGHNGEEDLRDIVESTPGHPPSPAP